MCSQVLAVSSQGLHLIAGSDMQQAGGRSLAPLDGQACAHTACMQQAASATLAARGKTRQGAQGCAEGLGLPVPSLLRREGPACSAGAPMALMEASGVPSAFLHGAAGPAERRAPA